MDKLGGLIDGDKELSVLINKATSKIAAQKKKVADVQKFQKQVLLEVKAVFAKALAEIPLAEI